MPSNLRKKRAKEATRAEKWGNKTAKRLEGKILKPGSKKSAKVEQSATARDLRFLDKKVEGGKQSRRMDGQKGRAKTGVAAGKLFTGGLVGQRLENKAEYKASEKYEKLSAKAKKTSNSSKKAKLQSKATANKVKTRAYLRTQGK